ncbi:Hypothetical protein PHPALM_3532 [Phytophthora palmivora]|uniref:Uncharacterized protein n=1 Tax=Phytophthora palmivora TaxID=4796 RepID=A0A2P4YM73_9STRA|nr:Hypothetical protein PHPALM_3532 [Phytophthora palmivora]
MAGDVAAAYSNAIHSECANICVAHIPVENAIVIDLSAAFSCPESAGREAVAFIHDSSTGHVHATGFNNYHWVDGHVNVGPDVSSRCTDIDGFLRFAMTAVMGPAAVNKDKFTP